VRRFCRVGNRSLEVTEGMAPAAVLDAFSIMPHGKLGTKIKELRAKVSGMV
jgi:hypothetical protein